MTQSDGLPASSSKAGSRPSGPLGRFAASVIRSALNLVFPERCAFCGRVGSALCESHIIDASNVPPARDKNSPLAERRATAEFEDAIQIAIHGLKYNGKKEFVPLLGRRLVDELARSGWKPTMITAAPLHPEKLKSRGYNQSALLADFVTKQTGIRFNPEAIRRVRDTRPQVGLGRKDRQANMADAFEADPAIVKGQSIVIVDDVYTTGATLRACASALLEAGASQVWALTVARAGSMEMSAISN